MASYLITGANRGIGLELVTQLAQAPSSQVSIVFAASRQSEPSNASSPLQNLIDTSSGRVVHVPMVITSRASLDKAAAEVEAHLAKLGDGSGDTKGLDVLINNAGVMPLSPQGIAMMDNLRYALEVNVEAAHETIAAFLQLLQRGTLKKVVNMYLPHHCLPQAFETPILRPAIFEARRG
jgi:NAD(P)-dependent dehydrogenase (short-subunit alcohol dehydrogenase family)